VVLEVISEGISPDCGCTERHIIFNMIECHMHIENTGEGHSILLAGDWDFDLMVSGVNGIDELQNKTIDYINTLPEEQ